jgi:hypothetical protein
MLTSPPWVPVAVPVPEPPPDLPAVVWIDTGSNGGLEVRVPPEERWRIWDAGGRHCLLLGDREDRDAAQILGTVRTVWGPVHLDPDEQDVS